MTFDLSFLQPKKMEPWYELSLFDHKDLAEHNRTAHFYSMLHSQKHDYKADIRLVLTERDITRPGADPFSLDAYAGAPSIATGIKVSREVVIRHPSRPGEELLVLEDDGRVTRPGYTQGFTHNTINRWRPRAQLNTGQVADHVTRPTGKRTLDL